MARAQVDIYTASYWVYFLYRYSGLSSYCFIQQRKHKRPKISVENVIVNILLIIIFIVLSYVVFAKCQNSGSDINSIFNNIQSAMTFMAAPILWIAAQKESKRVVNVFKAIDDVDKKFNLLTENEFCFIRNHSRSFWLIHIRRMIFGAKVLIVFLFVLIYVNPFCFVSYWITYWVIMNGGCMFLFFINDCTQLLGLMSRFIQRLLAGNENVVCLETVITPKVDMCYKLEEIRLIYSNLSDIVTETNKIFQVSLLIKVIWTFFSALSGIYGIIQVQSSFSKVQLEISYALYGGVLLYSLMTVVDFVLDIYAYEALIDEVLE